MAAMNITEQTAADMAAVARWLGDLPTYGHPFETVRCVAGGDWNLRLGVVYGVPRALAWLAQVTIAAEKDLIYAAAVHDGHAYEVRSEFRVPGASTPVRIFIRYSQQGAWTAALDAAHASAAAPQPVAANAPHAATGELVGQADLFAELAGQTAIPGGAA